MTVDKLNVADLMTLARNTFPNREGREAMLELRKAFYERKRRLEALQKEADDARRMDMKAFFWKSDRGQELRRLTNLCRNIVALFNDLNMSLYERRRPAGAPLFRTAPAPAPTTDGLHRPHYTGLGDE
jgi:hypothetical protein